MADEDRTRLHHVDGASCGWGLTWVGPHPSSSSASGTKQDRTSSRKNSRWSGKAARSTRRRKGGRGGGGLLSSLEERGGDV
ncbi:hypothetical protein EYF80_049949 [Liparis tanakae]|uniref:Uncharacterized protein n=1 Tax=Liparis tanakae TaxID=230148 RepID=A0A4Z2FF77_9TELE|nr:hypothetical protein EYF80_049949 [Liparis tanakae]